MMDVVLASSNAGKMAEIRDLLNNLPIKLISQSELGISDADETGTTFIENAIIKARHAAKQSGLPALSDDSGLAIDALGGAPGVYSSRYAGPGATDWQRIQKVLESLRAIKAPDLAAAFHCVVVFIRSADDPAPLVCHGIWPGKIVMEPRGEQGFGYDPIFYVPTHDCVAAELDRDEKNRMSHRARALSQLLKALEEAGILPEKALAS